MPKHDDAEIDHLEPAWGPVDLTNDGLVRFTEPFPEAVRSVLNRMEAAENWPGDASVAVADAIAQWASEMSDQDLRDLLSSPPGSLIEILAYVRASRCFALLDALLDASELDQWFQVIEPASIAARESPAAALAYKLLAARIAHLTQSELLHRIFSPKRADRITEALAGVSS